MVDDNNLLSKRVLERAQRDVIIGHIFAARRQLARLLNKLIWKLLEPLPPSHILALSMSMIRRIEQNIDKQPMNILPTAVIMQLPQEVVIWKFSTGLFHALHKREISCLVYHVCIWLYLALVILSKLHIQRKEKFFRWILIIEWTYITITRPCLSPDFVKMSDTNPMIFLKKIGNCF